MMLSPNIYPEMGVVWCDDAGSEYPCYIYFRGEYSGANPAINYYHTGLRTLSARPASQI
jgi:hypothetical protein